MAIIECIPNISEGRRQDVLDRCADAIRGAGVKLLDVKPDAVHHRTVYCYAGAPDQVRAATLAWFETALGAIDLRQHQGEHPRLGAVDVVAFVPIDGATMADCVAMAKDVAAAVSDRHGLPVYLYEEAASTPALRNLEDIRRGEFEGLAAKMASPGWAPDFGPAAPHASAGASVIGARMPLIAYHINLALTLLDRFLSTSMLPAGESNRNGSSPTGLFPIYTGNAWRRTRAHGGGPPGLRASPSPVEAEPLGTSPARTVAFPGGRRIRRKPDSAKRRPSSKSKASPYPSRTRSETVQTRMMIFQ